MELVLYHPKYDTIALWQLYMEDQDITIDWSTTLGVQSLLDGDWEVVGGL